MELVKVKFDQTKEIEVEKDTTYLNIVKYSIYKDTVLGVKKNNEIIPLDSKISENSEVEFFDSSGVDGAKMYQAGIKFLFEVALKTIYPEAEVYFLHSVPGGMLAEINYLRELSIEDISRVKGCMANIVISDLKFIKYNVLNKEAIDYYNNRKLYEKANNISITDNILTMYKLGNYLNYFYVDMPYSTKNLKVYELRYLGKNRLIITYPNSRTNNKLPEYVHHENIINSYYEGENWLKLINTPYVSDLNKLVANYEIKGFIESCELHFNEQIKSSCNEILRTNMRKFVMIAGPSSSGKTTTTRVLGAYLRSKGYDPICLSTDDYFVERVDTPRDSKGDYDYECLQAIDINLLNSQLSSLLRGEEVNIPEYNFITGKKEYHNKVIKLKENSIILIEGLHSLNDDLTPTIPNEYKYKIYLSPFIPLNIDRHNYISTLDLRLLRRMLRDSRTRGHSAENTIKTWQSVRNGEEKYIFPYTHQANTIINTALPYEIGVLKVFLEPLLMSISKDSLYYAEAKRLLKFLKSFYPISSEYVSKNSILREFIGGKE